MDSVLHLHVVYSPNSGDMKPCAEGWSRLWQAGSQGADSEIGISMQEAYERRLPQSMPGNSMEGRTAGRGGERSEPC